jgi:hypothetical protein
MNRMRLGPGKHLHGKQLMGGIVKGEEFDYFQYVRLPHSPLTAASSSSTKRWSESRLEATVMVSTRAW